jgi:hypothetical protein
MAAAADDEIEWDVIGEIPNDSAAAEPADSGGR